MFNKVKSRFSGKYIILFFLTLFIFTKIFAADYIVPKKPASVDVADIDMDGDLDIVVGHHYWNDWSGISILTNNSYCIFSLVDSFYYGGNHSSLFILNLNNNNFYDIITEYYDDIENTGLGVIFDFYDNLFENHYFLNDGAGNLKIGDIDSDDDVDVLFYCNPFFFWGYINNIGLGQFSSPEYYYLDYPPTDLAIGDLNGDDREDIVVSGQDVEIYFNYESGFYCYLLGDHELRVRIADVDNDGDNDIIGLTSPIISTGITIYENLGNNNFYEHDQFFFQTNTTQLQISDLNNDGLIDLICSGGYNNGIYILYNNGNFDFSEPQFFFTGEDTRKLNCEDLDNNNYNDIIALTHYTIAPDFGRLHILFNDGNGNFVEDPQVGIFNYEFQISKCKLSNYPNPFKPSGAGRSPGTTISFNLPINVRNPVIEIFNIKGERIRQYSIFNNQSSIVWNGTNNYSKPVSSGVYMYRLKTDEGVLMSKKMLLLK